MWLALFGYMTGFYQLYNWILPRTRPPGDILFLIFRGIRQMT